MSKIHSTSNYGQFGSLTYNRETMEKHVQALVSNIREKNLLHLNPIIVSKDMDVIDGQHRLAAAKQLNVPIFYMIIEDYDGTEIHRLNSVSKNWTNKDYLDYWTIKRRPGYNVLSNFIKNNPEIPFSSSLQLLDSSFERDTERFRNGDIDVSNLDEAEQIAAQLKDFRNRNYDIVYSTKFITSIYRINQVEGYSHAKMLRKLDMQPQSLVKCVNIKQMIMLLEEIYNYKEQKKIRFI